jgi:GAF domain-containing protein
MKTALTTDEAFEAFMQTFEAEGVRAGLAYLLALTDYRFIGIFRFEGGRANAAVHFDRENPGQLTAQEVPETATYCCYVRDSRGVFTTANAMRDDRLINHPARDVVLSYCGVPVMTSEGEILGTLCHYDLVPRNPKQVDLALMLQVASTLAQRQAVPPYSKG